MEEYLLLGYITDSFGLDGTVKVLSKTQFGVKRYQKGNVVFLYNEEKDIRLEAKVISYRHNGLFDFVKLDIINTKEEAEEYRHFEIQVLKNRNDLSKGEYFYSDLKQCEIYESELQGDAFIQEMENRWSEDPSIDYIRFSNYSTG